MPAVKESAQGQRAGHTPTPWKAFKTTDGRKVIGIGEVNGDGITDGGFAFGLWGGGDPEALANAEFIVRACNSHDELVAALELTELWLANCVPVTELDLPKPLPVIRAALARASGDRT